MSDPFGRLAWLENLGSKLPNFVPKPIRDLLDEIGGRLEHVAALWFGFVFCACQYHAVFHLKQNFDAQAFGIGAAAIMGCWKAMCHFMGPRDIDPPTEPKEGA